MRLLIVLSGACLLSASLAFAQLSTSPGGVSYQPTLPGAPLFAIGSYNAAGDGVTDDTNAISNALTACANAGGGTVILGPHRYLVNSGNLSVPVGCQVYCPAPLLGSQGATNPINFTTTPFTVLLNSSFSITLNNYSAWRGCAVLQKNASTNPVTTRDLLNLAAAFAGTAFIVGSDTEIDDTFVGGFQLGITTSSLHGSRARLSRVNVDANQCVQFDNIFDIADVFALHCFPFLMNNHAASDPFVSISGVANNGSGLYRVTTSSAHVIQTGDTVWVTGITGANSAINRWTATFVDSTHVDLQGSTATGATPTANTVNGSQILTNLSSLSGISNGTNLSGAGIPASTTALAVLYTCNCVLMNKAATATASAVTITASDTAYSSGGSIYLQADWRPNDGITFTNTTGMNCVACFVYNHATNFHISTGALWIALIDGASDLNAGAADPRHIAVLMDGTSKASRLTGFSTIGSVTSFVVNSSAAQAPHMITGSNIDAAQGVVIAEFDSGALDMTGNAAQVGGKWVTVMDAISNFVYNANNAANFSATQSNTSLAKIVNGNNHGAHTGRGGQTVTASACGTTPTVNPLSTDWDGVVTEGTTATGCTINFAQGFNQPPQCTVASQSALTTFAYSVNANTITVTHGSASNSLVNWHCASHEPQ